MKLTFDMRRILKGRQDIDKICVVTCAKHEKNYIVDYVDYYINKMLFDMVIIADNNDDNDDENDDNDDNGHPSGELGDDSDDGE